MTALAFFAEVGDFSRFKGGRKAFTHVGPVPHEGSSADRRSHGRMTKSGTSMLRKPLAGCSWAISRRGRTPKKKLAGNQDACERCVRLPDRPQDRRNAFADRRTKPNKANERHARRHPRT